MNFYIYIALSVLFILACLYSAYQYYVYFVNKKESTNYLENKEFLKKASNVQSELYFFHTQWCPHCKTSMPVWENIQNSTRFKRFNIHFMSVDCEDKKNAALVEKHKIKEYPSFVLTAKGKNYIYDANLSSETLEKFIVAVYEKI